MSSVETLEARRPRSEKGLFDVRQGLDADSAKMKAVVMDGRWTLKEQSEIMYVAKIRDDPNPKRPMNNDLPHAARLWWTNLPPLMESDTKFEPYKNAAQRADQVQDDSVLDRDDPELPRDVAQSLATAGTLRGGRVKASLH